MTKHRLRDSIRSLLGSHIDPEKHDELKGTKTEIDDKVSKILELIKEEDHEKKEGITADSKKDNVVELIDDFHKHYLTLYEQYYHLTGELRKEVQPKHEGGSSSSSSDSDLDKSSNAKARKNLKFVSESRKKTDDIKQELGESHLQVADLKRKLTSISEEKESLNSELTTALSKIEGAERTIGALVIKAETLGVEKSEFLVQIEELNKKLKTAAESEAELKRQMEAKESDRQTMIKLHQSAYVTIQEGERSIQQLETVIRRLQQESKASDQERERSTKELEAEIGRLKQEVKATKEEAVVGKNLAESTGMELYELQTALEAREKETDSLMLKFKKLTSECDQATAAKKQLALELDRLKEKVSEREMEAKELGNENKGLKDQISKLETQSKEKENGLSVLMDEASDQVNALATWVNNLQEELDSLKTKKNEMERQFEREKQDFSDSLATVEIKKTKLTRTIADHQINNPQEELDSLKTEKTEMERQFDREKQDFSDSLATEEIKTTKLTRTITDHQINNLQEELDSLKTKKTEMQWQFEREKQDFSERLAAVEIKEAEITRTITDHQRMLEEIEKPYKKLSEEHKQKKDQLQKCKEDLKVAGRKMEDMRNEVSTKLKSADESIAELEQISGDLKRIVQVKEDEISTLVDDIHSNDVKLLPSTQKLQVADKALGQSEAIFEKAERKFQGEQKLLEERISANNEAYQEMIADLAEKINTTSSELETVILKFEEDWGKLDKCISVTVNEFLAAKNLIIETKREKEELQKAVGNLFVQLRGKEEMEFALREQVEKAESKFQGEQKLHEERISANHEAYQELIADFAEKINTTTFELVTVISKFEEEWGKYDKCISETASEVLAAKNLIIETKREKDELQKAVGNLFVQLRGGREEQEFALREQVEKLDRKKCEVELEKESLTKEVSELMKRLTELEKMMEEKNEFILRLGEEKRVAIRQLCVGIDYYRSRYDDLKEVFVSSVSGSRAS